MGRGLNTKGCLEASYTIYFTNVNGNKEITETGEIPYYGNFTTCNIDSARLDEVMRQGREKMRELGITPEQNPNVEVDYQGTIQTYSLA